MLNDGTPDLFLVDADYGAGSPTAVKIAPLCEDIVATPKSLMCLTNSWTNRRKQHRNVLMKFRDAAFQSIDLTQRTGRQP